MRLKGRIAVVTGGGTGIGRAIAERLAGEGAAVVLAARGAERLEAAAAAIRERGGRALAVAADVTRRDSVEALARATREAFGPTDVLVNNSGIYPAHLLLDFPEDEWRETIATNLDGAFRCIQVFAPAMKERRFGRIVNVTSPSAFLGFQTMGAYAASKGGLVALTRCAAAELGPFGITANCVCPGATATEKYVESYGERGIEGFARILPLRRIGRAEDCAGVVALLCSEDGSYVTGETIVVDGGLLGTFPSAM